MIGPRHYSDLWLFFIATDHYNDRVEIYTGMFFHPSSFIHQIIGCLLTSTQNNAKNVYPWYPHSPPTLRKNKLSQLCCYQNLIQNRYPIFLH